MTCEKGWSRKPGVMLSKLEELKLISQCALADNRRAFGELVEAYQPRLRRFLMNLTMGDTFLSDDLAQETFIKAYINIRSFKGISSFSTWLYRIAYNEFYNEKRRKHEESMPRGDDGVEVLPTEATSVPFGSADARLTVQAAMGSLNDNERTVVTLYYIEDLSIKKISSIMQSPEGTVKSNLYRAKEKMGKFIQFENNFNLV